MQISKRNSKDKYSTVKKYGKKRQITIASKFRFFVHYTRKHPTKLEARKEENNYKHVLQFEELQNNSITLT